MAFSRILYSTNPTTVGTSSEADLLEIPVGNDHVLRIDFECFVYDTSDVSVFKWSKFTYYSLRVGSGNVVRVYADDKEAFAGDEINTFVGDQPVVTLDWISGAQQLQATVTGVSGRTLQWEVRADIAKN